MTESLPGWLAEAPSEPVRFQIGWTVSEIIRGFAAAMDAADDVGPIIVSPDLSEES
jgi:hypothetical protein